MALNVPERSRNFRHRAGLINRSYVPRATSFFRGTIGRISRIYHQGRMIGFPVLRGISFNDCKQLTSREGAKTPPTTLFQSLPQQIYPCLPGNHGSGGLSARNDCAWNGIARRELIQRQRSTRAPEKRISKPQISPDLSSYKSVKRMHGTRI